MGKKVLMIYIFKILPKSPLLGPKMAKNVKFGHFGPQKWTFWKTFEKVIPKSFLDHFSLYFYIINLYWKSPISAIPGRTQMLISRARKKILTFRKKR